MLIVDSAMILLVQDILFPSIYDALLIVRPLCNYRDGVVMRNVVIMFSVYLFEMLFLDSYLSGLVHVLPAKYQSSLSFSKYICIECIDMTCHYIPDGFLICIALGPTDG